MVDNPASDYKVALEKLVTEMEAMGAADLEVKKGLRGPKRRAEDLLELVSFKNPKELAEGLKSLKENGTWFFPDSFSRWQLDSLKFLTRPPNSIKYMADCVLLQFYKELDYPHTIDYHRACPPLSWGHGLKLLQDFNLVNDLVFFDPDRLNGEIIELMEPILRMKDFRYNDVTRVCLICGGLFGYILSLKGLLNVNHLVSKVKLDLASIERRVMRTFGVYNKPKHVAEPKTKKPLEWNSSAHIETKESRRWKPKGSSPSPCNSMPLLEWGKCKVIDPQALQPTWSISFDSKIPQDCLSKFGVEQLN